MVMRSRSMLKQVSSLRMEKEMPISKITSTFPNLVLHRSSLLPALAAPGLPRLVFRPELSITNGKASVVPRSPPYDVPSILV